MTVWLVGAGPGDPGLITARGLELARRCEVLVYDRLVAEELVGEAPADAILVPRDAHEQAEINELLVRLARQGLRRRSPQGRRPVRVRPRRRGGARARRGRT